MKKSPNAIDIHVGSMVRQLRTARGMSQTTLGEKLGITFQQIQKYERGHNRIGAGRLQDIATIFGVDIQTLFPAASADGTMKLQAFSKDAGIIAATFDKIQDRKVQLRIKALIKAIAGIADEEPAAA